MLSCLFWIWLDSVQFILCTFFWYGGHSAQYKPDEALPESGFHEYHSLTPDVTYEQMEIFLKYHNRSAVQRRRANGNVGRMSCEILRTRPLWLWLRLKEEARTLLSLKKLNMEAYIQRDQIGCSCIPPLLKNQNIGKASSLSKPFYTEAAAPLKTAWLCKEVTDELTKWWKHMRMVLLNV